MTTQHFPIRDVDRRVFDALKDGTKRVETRAGSPRYEHVRAGDSAFFDYGAEHLTKYIVSVRKFTSITALLKKYEISAIAPWCKNTKELMQMYDGFPGYRELINKHGIIALELR